MSDYMIAMKTISTMDEKQLQHFFHDLDDLPVVERIVEAAKAYLEKCEGSDIGEHESVDWKRQDDAQRYADIKSTQDSMR